MAMAVNQGSPLTFFYSSPHSSLLLEGQTGNQQVPRSPGLSPFPGLRQPAKRSVPSPSNSSGTSPAAVVGDTQAAGAYSGSPLLRQLLRGVAENVFLDHLQLFGLFSCIIIVGRKRQREGSPTSPLATSPVSKRLRQVPTFVSVTSRQQQQPGKRKPSMSAGSQQTTCVLITISTGPFQVVPRGSSPQLVKRSPQQQQQQQQADGEEPPRRQLPETNNGTVKTLELFSGDDIFAHEE